jgi:hypothetical protein
MHALHIVVSRSWSCLLRSIAVLYIIISLNFAQRYSSVSPGSLVVSHFQYDQADAEYDGSGKALIDWSDDDDMVKAFCRSGLEPLSVF